MLVALTQARLKELLHYDPDTGLFTWLNPSDSWRAARAVAACPSKGYIVIRVDGVLYTAGRLAWLYMTGSWPKHVIDHEDRDKANNRWKNLRDVTQAVNSQNTGLKKNNTSGHVGVSWDKKYEKWAAYIHFERRKRYLGHFEKLADAVHKRKQAEVEFFSLPEIHHV